MKNKNLILLEKELKQTGYIQKDAASGTWYINNIKVITSLGWSGFKDNFTGYLHFDTNKLSNKKEIDETKISLKDLSLKQIRNYLKLISQRRVLDLLKYDYSRKFRKCLSDEKFGKLNSFKNKINNISLSIENKILQEYDDINNIYINNLNCRTSYQKFYFAFEEFSNLCELPKDLSRKDIDSLNRNVGKELSGSRDCLMNWVEKHRKDYPGQKNQVTLFTEKNSNINISLNDDSFYNVDHLFERTIISNLEIENSKDFNLKHEDFVLLYEKSLDKEDFFKNVIKYYIAREMIAVKAVNNSNSLKKSELFKESFESKYYSFKEIKKDKFLRKELELLNVINDSTIEFVKGYLTLIFSVCEKICNKENYKGNISLYNNITDCSVSDMEFLYLLMNPLDKFRSLTGSCNPYFKKNIALLVKALQKRYNNFEMLEECSIYFKKKEK
tara:strand:+ start:3795 stop:5123 length:1329 start_codon:yes stop_codon:yes gene_type:complete